MQLTVSQSFTSDKKEMGKQSGKMSERTFAQFGGERRGIIVNKS
jgi:hypothetical protein